MIYLGRSGGFRNLGYPCLRKNITKHCSEVRTSVVTFDAFASMDFDMAVMARWRYWDSARASAQKPSVVSILARFARP